MYDRSKNIINISGKQLISGVAEYPFWGNQAVYVFPTAGMQMEVVSSSTADAAAGTGARTIEIKYIEAVTYLEKIEIVTLNGTTPVATVAENIFRINEMNVLTAGTGLKAAGKIDIRNLADTPIYGTILAGANEAQQAIYTVPAGKTLKIKSINYGNDKSTTISVKSNYKASSGALVGSGATGILYEYWQTRAIYSNFIWLPDPIIFPEKSDVIVTTIGVATTIASVDLRGELE